MISMQRDVPQGPYNPICIYIYIHIYIIHFLLLNTPNWLDVNMVYGKYGNAKATDLLIRYVAKFVLRYSGRFIDPFFFVDEDVTIDGH